MYPAAIVVVRGVIATCGENDTRLLSPPHVPRIDKAALHRLCLVYSLECFLFICLFSKHLSCEIFSPLVLCCGAQGRSEKAAEAAAAVAAAAAATASSRSGLSSVVHQVNNESTKDAHLEQIIQIR